MNKFHSMVKSNNKQVIFIKSCSKCPFLHSKIFGSTCRVVKECALMDQIIPTILLNEKVRHKNCPIDQYEVTVRPVEEYNNGWYLDPNNSPRSTVSPFDSPIGRLLHPNLSSRDELRRAKERDEHCKLLTKLEKVVKELKETLDKKQKEKTVQEIGSCLFK